MAISKADQATLNTLRWHWEDAYAISVIGREWVAQRRDNGQLLIAADSEQLRDLIRNDYAGNPVQRGADE